MENEEGDETERNTLCYSDIPGVLLSTLGGAVSPRQSKFPFSGQNGPKPYRLGWHIPIWHVKGNTLGPRHIADNPH